MANLANDQAFEAVPPLTDALRQDLEVPSTTSELAASFGKSRRIVAATLWNLKKQGRVRRTDNQVPIDKSERSKKGRRGEYLWEAV
jgi:hypothetical protein